LKKQLTYFFLLLSFLSLAQQKVKIHVTFTNSYCGGAAPTPEILDKYEKPQDLSDFVILLESKKTLKVKTDSLGYISNSMKPGVYKIYLSTKTNPNLYTNYNPSCDKMLHEPYGKLTIEKSKKNYVINLHFPCNLCEPNTRP
jgi:hypothetical protein